MKHVLKLIILLIIPILLLFSCSEEKIEKVENIYFCNVENFDDSLKNIYDKSDVNMVYNGYNLKTNEDAFSGNNSLLLTKFKKFAFGTKITVKDTSSRYRILVKLKGNTDKVFVVAKGKDNFYMQSDSVYEVLENNWKIVGLDFKLPLKFKKGDFIKTYVWNFTTDSVYADDFSINLITYELK